MTWKSIIKSVEDLNLAISKIDITKGGADLATGLRTYVYQKNSWMDWQGGAIIATSKGITMESVVSQFVSGIAKGGRGWLTLIFK